MYQFGDELKKIKIWASIISELCVNVREERGTHFEGLTNYIDQLAFDISKTVEWIEGEVESKKAPGTPGQKPPEA